MVKIRSDLLVAEKCTDYRVGSSWKRDNDVDRYEIEVKTKALYANACSLLDKFFISP